jgi:uncharacterized Ntn-hydrolase superfamily protein
MRRGTYSIVARDPETGELGGAVQSHWFSVGSIVLWARPGVGAVATQSIAEPAYGPNALDLIAAGRTPGEALDELLAGDAQGRFRQLGAIAPAGEPVARTGDGCIAHAGDAQGAHHSAQANLMASPAVWGAMSETFEAAEGPLARRLLAALEAGEAAGGDVRGRQSTALVVVPARGAPWERVVELRVEDDPEPLAELGRLLDVADAYRLADEGDSHAGAGRHDEASRCYSAAAALQPGNHELLFWSGLGLAQAGDLAAGADRVTRALELQPGWREVLASLSAQIAPAAPAVRSELGIDERRAE